ncbi:MAG: hypothetical protein HN404_11030 [Gemmatimonadetes bacterium]|nr:hypothetical protein [Gemmatimonadota bacterium]
MSSRPVASQAAKPTQQIDDRTSGTYSALVIFARFADESASDNAKPIWADDLFDASRAGSFTHFYNEMSRGQLNLDGDVLPRRYVSLSPRADYIAPQQGAFGDYGRFNLEILEQADADVDMGRFDNDGPDGLPNSGDDDGYVDILFINLLTVPRDFFIGGATGLASLGLMTDFLSDDPAANGGVVRVRSQFSGFGGTTQRGHVFRVTAATMCHEFAHVLGLPDLFDQSTVTATGEIDPEVDSAGIGKWGLMGLGTLGWGIEDGPNAFSAWSLAQLGWLGRANANLVELTESAEGLQLLPIDRDGRVLRVPVSEDEYFLIENRQSTDSYYNRNIPGGGLLLWHVDERADNDEERHKQVDLVCADGLFADRGFPGRQVDRIQGGDNLDFWARDAAYAASHNGNDGDATDPFDGVVHTRFAADTNPPAHAHTGFSRGAPLGFALERIHPVGSGVMGVDVLLHQALPGNIGQDTRWSGVVEIDGDVVVEAGARLTLAAGVEVRFADGDARSGGFDPAQSELIVYGELEVEGTATAPATLRAAGAGWLGLLLLSGGSADLEGDLTNGRLVVEDADLGLARARLPLGTTRWQGTKRIPWDLVVPAGAHLLVEEGARITFSALDLAGRGRHPDLTELIIEGELEVDGGSGSVSFSVHPGQRGDLWYGIRLEGDGAIGMDGLRMSGAGFAIHGDVSPLGRVHVADSRFSGLVNGLHLTLFGDALVDGSEFQGITGPAVRAGGLGTMRLRHTMIELNGQEGVWLSNANLEAISTTIRSNGQLDADDPRSGIFAEGGAGQRLELWDSEVEANRRHGIEADDWLGQIEMHRTSISSNRADGVRVNGAERTVFEDVELLRNLGRGADLAATTVEMWTTTATDNVAGGARIGEGARAAVDMSHFSGNTLLLTGTSTALVRNSDFSGTGVALHSNDAAPDIVANRFHNNTIAIRVDGAAVPGDIRTNTFTQNATAIDNRSGRTLSAPGNFWGTPDSTLIAGLMSGAVDYSGYLADEPVTTVVADEKQAPNASVLYGNWPNPFNGQTLIGFSLPSPAPIQLSIYDVAGQLIWRHATGVALMAGHHEIAWRGTDARGMPTASGVYIYELRSRMQRVGIGRMMLLR